VKTRFNESIRNIIAESWRDLAIVSVPYSLKPVDCVCTYLERQMKLFTFAVMGSMTTQLRQKLGLFCHSISSLPPVGSVDSQASRHYDFSLRDSE
jgi:hypothetical protein